MSTLNRAIKRHLKPILQTGATILAEAEAALALVADSPEKADAKSKLEAFHLWAADAVRENLGMRLDTTGADVLQDDVVAFVGTPKDNNPPPPPPGG